MKETWNDSKSSDEEKSNGWKYAHLCLIANANSNSGKAKSSECGSDSKVIYVLAKFNKLEVFKAINHMFD